MREYGFCCIACQLGIMIFDQIKTLFDVTDVVELQKFVIQEFRDRHKHLYELHKKATGEVIRRYKIDHMNM